MRSTLSDQVRDAGYETLFLLGGFAALSVQPTLRNFEGIMQWMDEAQSRRTLMKGLERRGLVESAVSDGKWVPRLTELGRVAFSGGRHPEERWNRSWDGSWRLLTFDLPRRESAARMKLRRWLSANHFGRLQGSVWISPDPVDDVVAGIVGEGVDPSMVMMFEGGLVGDRTPREVAALAWDFGEINKAYRRYVELARKVQQQVRKKTPSPTQLRSILSEDRQLWWDAVRGDPLLPKKVLPKGYEGAGAWEERCRLLERLGEVVGS